MVMVLTCCLIFMMIKYKIIKNAKERFFYHYIHYNINLKLIKNEKYVYHVHVLPASLASSIY